MQQHLPHRKLSPFLYRLIEGVKLTGNVHEDVPAFLTHHGYPKTAEHCAQVAAEAQRVAERVGEDSEMAALAGWLHDCSAIFPADERVQVAHFLQIPVLPEEEIFPMIIHQKLSKVLASELFGIHQEAVLDAIECHTTLRVDATSLDKVLFVADKIAWDGAGLASYHDELIMALEKSLDAAAFVYLHYLWERRYTLKVLHPWAYKAYMQLAKSSLL